MKRPHLLPDWRDVLRRAWSIRWIALAFVLTMAEFALPAFSDAFPPRVFALLGGLATAAAFVTRLLAQRDD